MLADILVQSSTYMGLGCGNSARSSAMNDVIDLSIVSLFDYRTDMTTRSSYLWLVQLQVGDAA